MDLVIPLIIYTQRMTPRSRDKFRVVHSAMATLVVVRCLHEFRIGTWLQYCHRFSLLILFAMWSNFVNVIVFYIVFKLPSFQKMTHNKGAKYKYTINQLDTHDNVPKS